MAGYINQKVFILYEDEHLLVVKKPFGMESQRGKSFAMDQESLLRGYLSSKTKTDNPYLAVVHRLDRPVAGVMVYAKTKKAAADLSAQLQTENISKKYEAVVSGISNWLKVCSFNHFTSEHKKTTCWVRYLSKTRKHPLSYLSCCARYELSVPVKSTVISTRYKTAWYTEISTAFHSLIHIFKYNWWVL